MKKKGLRAEAAAPTGDHAAGVIDGPPESASQAQVARTPPAPEQPPADAGAPGPSRDGEHTTDESSYCSSSEDEAQRSLLTAMRDYVEPRAPLLQLMSETFRSGDTSNAEAIASFYSRQTGARERENHRIEDGNRLVYESFDERNLVDRRVNEGEGINFFVIESIFSRN